MPLPNDQPQQQGQGMLSAAAQSAAAVPPPQALAPGQPQPGVPPGAPPGSPPTVPPGAPSAGPAALPEAAAPSAGPSGVTIGEEPATERENKEYERISKAMQKVMYEQDSITDSVMQQLDPEDKIGSTTKATVLLIQQMDEKLDMDEIVIPQITMDAVEMVSELAENRFGISFSDQELQSTLGATWEGVMAMFGVDERSYKELEQEFGPQLGELEKAYKGFLSQGEKAREPAERLQEGQSNG